MTSATTPNKLPLLCFVGRSNCGKTTLMAQVIAELSSRGLPGANQPLKIAALKHSSHGFHMDKPGKDSYRFRQAGAYAIGLASASEVVVLASTPKPATLAELVAALPAPELDLVICEGFASEPAKKIGVHRAESPLPDTLEGLVAIVGEGSPYPHLPCFNASDVAGVSEFVLRTCGLHARHGKRYEPV